MPSNEVPTLSVHDPERPSHLLMLEFGDRDELDEPRLEYRRLFSELLGRSCWCRSRAGAGIPDHHVVEEATAAELAVRGCVATGLSRCEIGERLNIALNTVKTHTRELYAS